MMAAPIEIASEGAVAAPVGGDPPARASDILAAIADAGGAKVTLAELDSSLGERSIGITLLILALINCIPLPPFGTTVFGLALMLIAAQVMVGRRALWLPRCMRAFGFPRAGFRKGATRFVPMLRRIEKVCRPRLSWITRGPAQQLIGLAIVLLAFVISLPIPVIGNIPPALAVVLLSISLIEEDGFLALGGLLAGLGAILLNAGVVGGILVSIAGATETLF